MIIFSILLLWRTPTFIILYKSERFQILIFKLFPRDFAISKISLSKKVKKNKIKKSLKKYYS